MDAGRIVRAVAAHARSYEDPIAFSAGERVMVGRRDPEDPRWVWCVHPRTGKAGWVPEVLLEIEAAAQWGTGRRAYAAIELTVVPGERLIAGESVAGWTWCTKPSGAAGWMPCDKLAEAG